MNKSKVFVPISLFLVFLSYYSFGAAESIREGEFGNLKETHRLLPGLTPVDIERYGTHSFYFKTYPAIQRMLTELGWSEDEMDAYLHHHEELAPEVDELLQAEQSKGHAFRWGTLDLTVQKLTLLPFLSRSRIQRGRGCMVGCPAVWPRGRSIWVDQPTRFVVYGLEGFEEGLEEGIMGATKYGGLALMGYLASQSSSLSNFFHKLGNLHEIIGEDFIHLTRFEEDQIRLSVGVSIVLGLPVLGGIGKSVFNVTYRGRYGTQDIDRTLLELEDELQPKEALKKFWGDYVRWLLPVNTMQNRLNGLQNMLLWDRTLSSEDRQKIFHTYQALAEDSRGMTQIEVMYHLGHLLQGMHHRDYYHLQGTTDPTLLGEDMWQKVEAYRLLSRFAAGNELTNQPLERLWKQTYARYLLWKAGHPRSLSEEIGFYTFKLGKLAFHIWAWQGVIRGILDYLNCPDKPGFSYGGYAEWSSDYTIECFDALIRVFNTVPGEPASHITDQLGKYHFPGNTYNLDLSGKGLNGTVIAQILEGFTEHGIRIPSLNVSSNSLAFSQEMQVFLEKLNMTRSDLVTLDMSSVGEYNGKNPLPSDTLIMFSNNLPYFDSLRYLDLSQNGMGAQTSEGVVALSQTLSSLRDLRFLNVSFNNMGSMDSRGTISFSKSLKALSNLVSLDLSYNFFGNYGIQDVVSLAESLEEIRSLEYLSLGDNSLAYLGQAGVNALAKSFKEMKNLKHLNMKFTWIGYRGADGSLALANYFEEASSLSCLHLSGNLFGWWGNLTGVRALADSLKKQKTIEAYLFPLRSINSSEVVNILNSALIGKKNWQIVSIEDVNTYFETINAAVQEVSLSQKISAASPLGLKYLMKRLQELESLESLDLSHNSLQQMGNERPLLVAEGLSHLTGLRSLDLSSNTLGNGVFGVSRSLTAIGKSLGKIPNLKRLNIMGNLFGSSPYDSIGFANSLTFVPELVSLDLSYNGIGEKALAEAVAYGETLKFLTNMEYLNLGFNNIGQRGGNGTLSITRSLSSLYKMKKLDLGGIWLGFNFYNDTVLLSRALRNMQALEEISLTHNSLGYKENQGIIDLSEALTLLSKLKSLNLAYNNIGQLEGTPIELIVKSIVHLTTLEEIRLQEFNINGASRIPWSQAQQDVAGFYLRQLRSSCEGNLCFGHKVVVPTPGESGQVDVELIENVEEEGNLSRLRAERLRVADMATLTDDTGFEKATTAHLLRIEELEEETDFEDDQGSSSQVHSQAPHFLEESSRIQETDQEEIGQNHRLSAMAQETSEEEVINTPHRLAAPDSNPQGPSWLATAVDWIASPFRAVNQAFTTLFREGLDGLGRYAHEVVEDSPNYFPKNTPDRYHHWHGGLTGTTPQKFSNTSLPSPAPLFLQAP